MYHSSSSAAAPTSSPHRHTAHPSDPRCIRRAPLHQPAAHSSCSISIFLHPCGLRHDDCSACTCSNIRRPMAAAAAARPRQLLGSASLQLTRGFRPLAFPPIPKQPAAVLSPHSSNQSDQHLCVASPRAYAAHDLARVALSLQLQLDRLVECGIKGPWTGAVPLRPCHSRPMLLC